MEGKIIKKKVFHSILIVFVVIIAIVTSLFVAIQDPIIQKFAVRFAGGYLSEKTGADIKVGRLVVTPDFRVFIDDVVVKDLNDSTLAKVGALRTKINIGDLLEGKIHLENVELRDTEANLIKYEGEDGFNFAFLVDAFASDKPKEEKEKKPLEIVIDKISLKNVDFMLWNQTRADSLLTAQHLMDYAHLDLDDINLEANGFYLQGDSVHANIISLSANELSGFEVKSLQTDAVVCSNGVFLNGLLMETNNSRFDLDLNMLINGFDDFSSFVDSVVFDATIRPTDLMLSDIGVFAQVMYQMPDRVNFEGRFTGPIRNFRVDDIKAQIGNVTSFQGNISMHPLDFNDGYHTLNIKDMHFTYDDLANFYIPGKTKTIPLPESLSTLEKGRLSLDFKGSYYNFTSDIALVSDIGNAEVSIDRSRNANGDNFFSGNIDAERVKAGVIANADKFVGDLDVVADFSASFPKNGRPEVRVDGNASQAMLLGNNIDEVKLDGVLKENQFKGKVRIDDDDLDMDFNGLIDFSNSKYPKSNFEADIRYADLRALKILKEDSISQISTRLYVDLKGFNIDDLEGEIHLDSTLYRDSRGQYYMDDFYASIVDDNLMQRRIAMNCDFLNFEMAGQMNFASMLPVFKEYVDHYMHVPLWEEELADFEKYKIKHDTEQDFVLNLTLKDTKTLSRLLMPSVKIAKNTTLNGTFTSRTNALNLTLRSKNIQVGKVNFNNIELRNFNPFHSAVTALSLDEIAYTNITETDTLNLGLDELSIVTRMANDTLVATIKWDDETMEDHNKALITTYFHPLERGGIFSITEADVRINDTLWSVSPNNSVLKMDDKVLISNLMFGYHSQSIRVDGYVPMAEGDTMSVMMRRFDISNLDFLTKSLGFDIDGFISGDALVSSLSADPMVLASLDIERIAVNGDRIGDAVVESVWNNEKKSVDLNANILDGQKKTLNVTGSYYTARKSDNLDFAVELDSLQLNVLTPFLAGIVSRMQGVALGEASITGSLSRPEIQGRVTLHDGGCKIGYLNTFYTFNPTIMVDNSSISFENMVLTDSLGNKARVEGKIRHNNLKDFDLDLRLHPREFLALATSSKDNDTFYGTAVADGLVSVTGPFNDLKLGIDARTRRGTNITIPLNKSNTVKDNDFIVFINDPVEVDEDEGEHVEQKEKVKSNFSLKLNVNATDDANLKIILPSNLGTIDATGNGNVKMSSATSEDFTMYGDYTIKSGRFQLTLMDLVTRNFTLKQGGTIAWAGDPTDGRINATGSYSVRTSLSSLGIQVDSTATNSNVNVECLIHLKGALLNPTITFGMNLPNVDDDIARTVYSLVDTTNQAVMTSQALSLLVLNSFSYLGDSDFSLSNVLMGGMQMNITDNLDLGVSYHAGNANSYDEYQLAMRTQLFENRLTLETNLGMMTGNSAGNVSSIVGEFDLYYKLAKDGRLQAHLYNHSNYNSNFNSAAFDRRSPYTQGLGLSYSRSFDNFRNLFKKKTVVNGQPLIRPKK